ncbi:hypothetical protein NM203_25190 [Mycolicibacterium sp. CAU 1645]|uniref:Uncharacterized protein n=2 Tax=Mycolicibacterium arenosum TaxID=2952157 RepID=A0ABT1MAB3_9MYCO|nr:hypothetical protein [Mycolicibacterium sp. CAU 1645]
MAARFDAAARLAEGRPVVGDLIEYVAACRQLGYRHSDLTAHAAQVTEWYSGQDGLDLAALEADAAALRAVAAGTDDVARQQTAAVAALRDGWAGSGGGAAIDFLNRHQRAAESVFADARTAAEALTALRDDLWRAVDAQVAATLDAGAAAQRETWLAASRTLTTGAGDRATASELIDREVTPFVDTVIGGRWVAAMRAASESVAGAYQAAVTRLGGAGPTVFEVPFDLGPHATDAATPQAVAPQAVVPAVSAPVTPAAFSPQEAAAPPTASPAASAPLSAPVEPGLGAPAASTPAMPSLPSFGESGGMGSGPSGFGTGLADLLGGLGGLSDGGEFEPEQVDADPAEVDDEDLDDDEEPVDDDDPDDDPEDEDEVEDGAVGEPDVAEEVAPEPEPEPEPEPAPTPPPVEPLAAPPPPPVEAPPERTPCEIAADELPQVGQ